MAHKQPSDLLEHVLAALDHPELWRDSGGKRLRFDTTALVLLLIEAGDDDPNSWGNGFHLTQGRDKVGSLLAGQGQYATLKGKWDAVLVALAPDTDALLDQAWLAIDARLARVQ